MRSKPSVTLHVCVTCRAGEPGGEGPVAGQRLLDELQRCAGDQPVALRPVTCLANCERGCSAVLSGDDRWTYLLGRLGPSLAEDLLIYAEAFAGSRTGTVMPSKRPASLRDVVMGRVPPALAEVSP